MHCKGWIIICKMLRINYNRCVNTKAIHLKSERPLGKDGVSKTEEAPHGRKEGSRVEHRRGEQEKNGTRENLHCVTDRDGHCQTCRKCMEAEAWQPERGTETSRGRERLYSRKISIYLFIRVIMYISVQGHQQVATTSHKLYICLMCGQ